MRYLEHNARESVRTTSAVKPLFYPLTTIKCDGEPTFRSQAARDVACLLDVDSTVSTWSCQPLETEGSVSKLGPDFLVTYWDGRKVLIDAPGTEWPGSRKSELSPVPYERWSHEKVYQGFRLQNAKDLLRYGNWRTSLGDRMRLLAALDEHGSLSFAECLAAIQETRPVAGVASFVLSGFLEVDLDEAPLGPETMVRRIRR